MVAVYDPDPVDGGVGAPQQRVDGSEGLNLCHVVDVDLLKAAEHLLALLQE